MVAFFKQKMIFVVLQNNDFCKQRRFVNIRVQRSDFCLILQDREYLRNRRRRPDKHNIEPRR